MLFPKNSKDVAGLRSFLTALRTQTCSASEGFAGPLKELATELIKKLDGFVGELPKDDVPGDWALESKLDSLFALMAQASALASLAGLELNKLKAEGATQLAGAVNAEVNRRIEAGELVTKENSATAVQAASKAQVESGDLVPKATVTQLCADSKALGLKEGEQKVRDELTAAEARKTLIATRKQALQTAGLPTPDADYEGILAGSEQEFEAVKTTYGTRLEKLKKAGIQLAGSPLLSKLFMPEKEFGIFENTVSGIDALKTPPAETHASPEAETKPGKRPLVV